MITANNKDTKAINTLFVFLLLLLNPINSLIYCFSIPDWNNFFHAKNSTRTLRFTELLHLKILVVVFISNSIFHFSLGCFGKNYDFSVKVANKLLSVIFKFHMISA